MLIKYHTCDHCGKKLDTMYDYEDINIGAIDLVFDEVDLCVNCYDELKKLVTDFIHRSVEQEDKQCLY